MQCVRAWKCVCIHLRDPRIVCRSSSAGSFAPIKRYVLSGTRLRCHRCRRQRPSLKRTRVDCSSPQSPSRGAQQRKQALWTYGMRVVELSNPHTHTQTQRKCCGTDCESVQRRCSSCGLAFDAHNSSCHNNPICLCVCVCASVHMMDLRVFDGFLPNVVVSVDSLAGNAFISMKWPFSRFAMFVYDL